MKEGEETKEGLAGFKWDEASNDPTEFFGQKVEGSESTPVLTEEEKEQITQEALKKETDGAENQEGAEAKAEEGSEEKPKEGEGKEGEGSEGEGSEEGKDVKFFEQTEGGEGTEGEGGEGGEEDDKFFTNLAGELKEQGILTSVEIPEDEPLTQETFVKLQEDEIEARINETFEGFFEEMDEDGKAFLKFKKEGGTTKEFFDVLRSTTQLPEGDIDDEDYQKKVVRHFSTSIDEMDDEEVTDRIEWLEENDKLKKYAERYEAKLKTIDEKQKAALVRKAEQASKADEEGQNKFRKELKTALKEAESIKNIPITEDDKNELFNFITKPTVKIGKNKYLTGFQQKLQEMSTNHESLLLLAKLIKSDFDLSAIEVKAETKKTRNLRKTLERTGKSNKPTASKGSSKKNLSDYFD